jgi:hypothetical protein
MWARQHLNNNQGRGCNAHNQFLNMIPTNKRGAVTIALGHEGLAQLRAAAKRANTKPASVAKALIFSGIDKVLTGELKIQTKPTLTK